MNEKENTMRIDSSILYAPCPCGSGKKFKFCCLEVVRDNLPDNPTQAETTMEVRKAMQPYGLINNIDTVEDRESIKLIQEGIRERDMQNFDKALELLRKSRTMKPKLYTSWNNEATCLWECGRFDDAVNAQKDGLAYSENSNSFGWAQLAEFEYFLGENDKSIKSIERALAIPSLTEDCAAKICAVLALQKRHSDILKYAKSSCFDQSPWVAFYAGIAAMNTKEKDDAMKFLQLADKSYAGGVLVGNALNDLRSNKSISDGPFGEWQYFTIDSYEVGPLGGRAMAIRTQEHENIVCDLLEMMLADRRITKKDTFEALESLKGERSNRLREWLNKTDDFNEVSEDYEPYTSSGDEIAVQKTLKDLGIEAVTLDMSIEPGEKLEGEDHELFKEAVKEHVSARKGSKKWIKYRETFKDIYNRHPNFFRAGFNYAVMLKNEGNDNLADEIIRRIAKEHPEYAYAQAALANKAIGNNDLELAGKIVHGYHPPVRMHPIEYRAWLTTQLLYYVKIGDKIRAENTKDAIERIEEAFNL